MTKNLLLPGLTPLTSVEREEYKDIIDGYQKRKAEIDQNIKEAREAGEGFKQNLTRLADALLELQAAGNRLEQSCRLLQSTADELYLRTLPREKFYH